MPRRMSQLGFTWPFTSSPSVESDVSLNCARMRRTEPVRRGSRERS